MVILKLLILTAIMLVGSIGAASLDGILGLSGIISANRKAMIVHNVYWMAFGATIASIVLSLR